MVPQSLAHHGTDREVGDVVVVHDVEVDDVGASREDPVNLGTELREIRREDGRTNEVVGNVGAPRGDLGGEL